MEEVKDTVSAELQQIEDCFFDPYCTDESIVSHRLHQVEALLAKRGKQLDRLF